MENIILLDEEQKKKLSEFVDLINKTVNRYNSSFKKKVHFFWESELTYNSHFIYIKFVYMELPKIEKVYTTRSMFVSPLGPKKYVNDQILQLLNFTMSALVFGRKQRSLENIINGFIPLIDTNKEYTIDDTVHQYLLDKDKLFKVE